jgi:hypothetical protein
LLLWGVDELLVYHYLVSEAARADSNGLEAFWSARLEERAEWVWRRLFADQTPLSEACRGVLTTLQAFGLDPRAGDLASLRKWFAGRDPAAHVDDVLRLAGVRSVCMTNSPFDPEEQTAWAGVRERDGRFTGALRIDPLLLAWPTARETLTAQGYKPGSGQDAGTASEVRRFLAEWSAKFSARYTMVSLPPSFAYPADNDTAWLLDNAVLPFARETGQAFAVMMGVKRGVNPELRMAGDGVGRSDLTALENLCRAWPKNRFMATCLSRENQHELVVLARKFPNLHPFGCWWFTNTPAMIGEITSMRLDLLGPTFTAQHSDARVLDQLVYKWAHTRAVLADCLGSRYRRLEASGWTVTDAEIARDAESLLGGAYRRFLG